MRFVLFCGLLALTSGFLPLQALVAPPAEFHSIFQQANAVDFPEELTAKVLPMDWFAVPITKGEGLFNPVFIPFTVKMQGVPNDPNQQYTFPTFLHYLLKFMTNNTSTSSPSFIFRQLPSTRLVRPDDKMALVKYIAMWDSTHAVGGDLTITPQGCTGDIQIYDYTGTRIYEKSYPNPLPYFTLLARMAEDWMTTSHQPVSDALKAEMERPMTTHMELVTWFGEMFTMPRFDPKEWEIYDRILATDPEFAEVRWWYANQKGWADDFTQQTYTEFATAFLHRIVPIAVGDYYREGVRDPAVVKAADAAVVRALTLVPNHPNFLDAQLGYTYYNTPQDKMDALLPVAQQSPGAQSLLHKLADYYNVKGQPAKSIPLALSAAQSRYAFRDGVSTAGPDYLIAASGYMNTGHPYAAAYSFMQTLQAPGKEDTYLTAVLAYCNLACDYFGFDEAANAAIAVYQKEKGKAVAASYRLQDLLCMANLACTASGKMDKLTPIAEDLAKVTGDALAYQQLCTALKTGTLQEGQAVKFNASPNAVRLGTDVDYLRERAITLADDAIQRKDPTAPQLAMDAWRTGPLAPRSAYLLQRAFGKERAQDLYRYAEVMCWLAPEVPYWPTLRRQALDDGAHEDSPATISTMLANNRKNALQNVRQTIGNPYLKTLPPFFVEYLVMKAITGNDQAQLDDAMSLYHTYTLLTTFSGNVYHTHLAAFIAKVLHALPANQAATWTTRMTSQVLN